MLKIEKAKLEHFYHVSFDKDIKLIKYKLDKNIKFISIKYLPNIT